MDVATTLAIAILPFLAVVIFRWVRDGDDDGHRGEKRGRKKRMGIGVKSGFSNQICYNILLFQNLPFC